MQIQNNLYQKTDLVKMVVLVEELPRNSVTRIALEAIQNKRELPDCFSEELKEKFQALAFYYNASEISEEKLRNIQDVFQKKISSIEEIPYDSLKSLDSVPSMLQNFSPFETEKILEMQEKYRLTGKKGLELLASIAELKSFEELSRYDEFVAYFVPEHLDDSLKRECAYYLFVFLKTRPVEELDSWKVLYRNFLVENISQSDVKYILSILYYILSDRSLKEAKELLQFIQDMIPINLSSNQKIDLQMSLFKIISDFRQANPLPFLGNIRDIFLKGLNFEQPEWFMKNLAQIFSSKSLDECNIFLNFVQNLSSSLDPESKLRTLKILVLAAKKSGNFEKLYSIWEYVYKAIPVEIPEKEKIWISAFWTQICAQYGMKLFTQPRYINYLHHWVEIAIPLIQPSFTWRTIEGVLKELLPPYTNDAQEAKSLVNALVPLLSVSTITNLPDLEKFFALYRSIKDPLRSEYSKLIGSITDKTLLSGDAVEKIMRWMQELNMSSYEKGEFFFLLQQKLQNSEKKEAFFLAKQIIQYQKLLQFTAEHPLLQTAQWIVSLGTYENSLQKQLETIPLNAFTVTALSGSFVKYAFFQKIKEYMQELEDIYEKTKQFASSSAPLYFQEQIFRDLYDKKIREKFFSWNHSSEIQRLEQLEQFFGLEAPFPPFYDKISLEDKFFVLQSAQFLIDPKDPIPEKGQFFSLLIALVINIPNIDRDSMMECVDSVLIGLDIGKKIEWLRFLEEKRKKIPSISDFQKVCKYTLTLLTDSMELEEKIFVFSQALEYASTYEEDINAIITTPRQQFLAALVLQRFPKNVQEKMRTSFFSSIDDEMSLKEIQNIGNEKSSIPMAMEAFKDKNISHECEVFISKILESFDAEDRISYTSLWAFILDRSFSIEDINSLIDLTADLDFLPDPPWENVCLAIQCQLEELVNRNWSKANCFASKIFSCQKILKLRDDSPVMELSIKVLLNSRYEKMPPQYLQALIKWKRNEYPSSYIEQTILPSSLFDAKAKILLSLKGLQKGVYYLQKEQKSYGEFKAWIEERNQFHRTHNLESIVLGPDVFKHFFEKILIRLYQQLQTNPPNLQQIQELIEEIHEMSLNFRYEDCLSAKMMQKPFLASDKKVPQMLMRLYLIADAILTQDSAFSEGHLLSNQEELGLAWLSIIENCSVGQEQGATKCYSDLKSAGIIRDVFQEQGILELENSQRYVAECVQKAMYDVIESDQILQFLRIEPEYVHEAGVHQALYLKNVLGMECGLNHEEVVDPFPLEVSLRLCNYYRQYLLQVFFYQFGKKILPSFRESFAALPPNLKAKTYNFLQDYFDRHHISSKKAWIVREPRCFISFKDEEQPTPITLEVLQRCLSSLPPEPGIWNLVEGGVQLTKQGISAFKTFLEKNKQDLSMVESTGNVTLANAASFLQFVENYKIEHNREEVYSARLEKLTEKGKALFNEEIAKTSSPVHKLMRASFRQPLLGKSWEEFVLDRIKNLKDFPLIRQNFLQIHGRYVMPWSLSQEPIFYELSDFGALALLEKEGYLQIQGPYKEYLRLSNEIEEVAIQIELQKRAYAIGRIPLNFRNQKEKDSLAEIEDQLKTLSQIVSDPENRLQHTKEELAKIEEQLLMQRLEDVPPPAPVIQERLL